MLQLPLVLLRQFLHMQAQPSCCISNQLCMHMPHTYQFKMRCLQSSSATWEIGSQTRPHMLAQPVEPMFYVG